MSVRKKRDWGTTAVLTADLIATMVVATWGILYVKTDLKYLLVIAAITFGLALLVALLLRGGKQSTQPHRTVKRNPS
jgi:hypothetical protein